MPRKLPLKTTWPSAGETLTLGPPSQHPASSERVLEQFEIAEINIRDVKRLRDIFQTGKRAFLINPPADPSGDTDKVELANVAAILAVLDRSALEKVVAASTDGAFGGERCGDLTGLHAFEQALLRQLIPVAINRA